MPAKPENRMVMPGQLESELFGITATNSPTTR